MNSYFYKALGVPLPLHNEHIDLRALSRDLVRTTIGRAAGRMRTHAGAFALLYQLESICFVLVGDTVLVDDI